MLLPFIVAVTTPAPLADLPIGLASYAGGALVAAITAVAMWPARETPVLQQAVARVLSASAAMVAGSPPLMPGATQEQVDALMREVIAADDALAKAYDGKLARPGNLTAQERGLVQLVDDAHRLRYTLGWPSDKAIDPSQADLDLFRAVHDVLTSCAEALSTGGHLDEAAPAALLQARHAHIQQFPGIADELIAGGTTDQLVAAANAGFYARLTSFLSAMVVRHARFALGQGAEESAGRADVDRRVTDISKIEAASAPVPLLRSNFTLASPWFRRALQTAIAVTVAVACIDLLNLQTGFWVVLGIAASLQLNAVGSRKSAVWVALGTGIGFGICVALVELVGSNVAVLIALLPFVAFITVWLPSGKYEVLLKQAGFTTWFVMLVSLAGHKMSMDVADRRIIDVAVGLAASLLITAVLWPHGVANRVRDVLDASVRSTADYFAAAYAYISSGLRDTDAAAIEKAAQSAVVARDRGADAFDVAISQGGAAGNDAAAWEMVDNAVDHAFFAATMVRELESYGLAPLPDAAVGASLRTTAHDVAQQFAATIDTVHDQLLHVGGPVTTTAPLDAATAETAVIERAIAEWAGRTGQLSYEIDGSPFAMSYGHAAVSMLWAQDWLLYFQWMAVRSYPTAAAAAASGAAAGAAKAG